MAENWYYVQNKNRHGPVAIEVIERMISKSELNPDDFVWKKGFEGWKKIREVEDFSRTTAPPAQATPELPAMPRAKREVRLGELGSDENIIYIRVGVDRNAPATEYGPYSVSLLRRLFKEKRINGKTEIFVKGSDDYLLLADVVDFQEIFEEVPPVIKESDRRTNARKPFIARLFIQNNKNFYEGICRDISIGGMQVLVDDFRGASNDRITINAHPENSEYHFVASGVVVRILEGNSGFSFRFHGLSDEAKRAIEKYLQDN